MDAKDLKKILTGLSLAGLLAGAGLMAAGCATSNGNGEKGAGSASEHQQPGMSG